MRAADLEHRLSEHLDGSSSQVELAALLELFRVCEAEREAKCVRSDLMGVCVGENHIETCPCEIARQDRIATLNKIEGM